MVSYCEKCGLVIKVTKLMTYIKGGTGCKHWRVCEICYAAATESEKGIDGVQVIDG